RLVRHRVSGSPGRRGWVSSILTRFPRGASGMLGTLRREEGRRPRRRRDEPDQERRRGRRRVREAAAAEAEAGARVGDRAPEPPPTTFRTTRMPPAPMNITLIECHAFRPLATAKIAPRTARATIAPASVSTNRLTAALPAHFFIASLSHPRDAGPTRDLHHILACAYVSVCLHYGHGGRAEGTRRTPPE